MTGEWSRLLAVLEAQGRAARVAVIATRGSTPREIGAAMVVAPDLGCRGTIGGGALEWRAQHLAAEALAEAEPRFLRHELLLGPDLGQCCGGRVTLAVEVFDAADLPAVRGFAALEADRVFTTEATPVDGRLVRLLLDGDAEPGLDPDGRLIERFGDERRRLMLFGAGHLGRALVLALAPLPFRVDWIDGRDDAFPGVFPGNVRPIRLADPVAAIAAAPAGAFVLAVTHDHALDLGLADAALRRDDLPYVGVVGSKTKRARFSSRLREMGLPDGVIRRMVLPVGTVGPRSKVPAVIAASIAVELLVADEAERAKTAAGPATAGRRRVWASGVGA